MVKVMVKVAARPPRRLGLALPAPWRTIYRGRSPMRRRLAALTIVLLGCTTAESPVASSSPAPAASPTPAPVAASPAPSPGTTSEAVRGSISATWHGWDVEVHNGLDAAAWIQVAWDSPAGRSTQDAAIPAGGSHLFEAVCIHPGTTTISVPGHGLWHQETSRHALAACR